MRACEQYGLLKFVSLVFCFCSVLFCFVFDFVFLFFVFFHFCWPLAKEPNNYESKCMCLGRFQNSIDFVNDQTISKS